MKNQNIKRLDGISRNGYSAPCGPRNGVMTDGGFTLIELLVVVLIIGILSSVALPKYTKAVSRSRAATVFSQIGTMRQAFIACRLAHPASCDTDELDVEMPEAKFPGYSNCSWSITEDGYGYGVGLVCSDNHDDPLKFEILVNDGTRLCCAHDTRCKDYGFSTYTGRGGSDGVCYSQGDYTAY